MADPPAVLQGLRVVEWAGGSGVRATSMLAAYGADVVWVEPPEGHPLRTADPVACAVFARDKRSVAVDLDTAAGREQLDTLLATADVFVAGQLPALVDRLGLDFGRLHEKYPSLVYCALSAFGPADDALTTLPAYEALVHARVGTMAEQVGYRPAPIYEGLPFAGMGAAYLAQIGILAALLRRRSNGIGYLVDTSFMDGALSYLSMLWGHADADDTQAPPAPGSMRLLSRTLLCGDGEYLGVHTGAAGAFGRLIQVLGLADQVPVDTGGADIGTLLDAEQQRVLAEEVPRIFASADRAVWLQKLTAADVCAIPALHPTEVFDEPQAKHNEMVVEVDDPTLGAVQQVAAPLRFRSTPVRAVRPAPRAGSSQVSDVLADWRTKGVGAAATPAGSSTPLLRGVRVLDLGVWYASGYSSRMLADLGADVVKVETSHGDQMRGMRRPFQSCHSRKRGVAGDLKDPAFAAATAALVRWADVIHHNMRPGAAERLGIGYEQAKALNPDIVYVHAPGWGTTGPETGRQSFAPLVSGYVGASYEVAGQFNPPTYPAGNEDPGAGMLGAIAILMALYRGGGDLIEIPQLNAAMNQMAHIVRGADGQALGAGRLDPLQRRISPYDGLYETADAWICVVAPTGPEARALCAAAGVVQSGEETEVSDRLEGAFASASTASWLTRLRAAGVAAVEPVTLHQNRPFHLDPANRATRRVSEVPGPDGATLRQLDTLIRFGGVDIPPFRRAPGLGEHTLEVLQEAGCSPEEIAALRASGAVVAG
ncbi:MAG: dddD [Frankiales bacterium]|nr:dddD [Frankiales bacterium]